MELILGAGSHWVDVVVPPVVLVDGVRAELADGRPAEGETRGRLVVKVRLGRVLQRGVRVDGARLEPVVAVGEVMHLEMEMEKEKEQQKDKD
jgi:hypothetical protein